MENLTLEQLQAQIAALQAQNEALRAALPKPKSSIKVSAKGGISVYGLGKFPVTLYASQWEALLAKSEDIKQFILDNADSLSKKGE